MRPDLVAALREAADVMGRAVEGGGAYAAALAQVAACIPPDIPAGVVWVRLPHALAVEVWGLARPAAPPAAPPPARSTREPGGPVFPEIAPASRSTLEPRAAVGSLTPDEIRAARKAAAKELLGVEEVPAGAAPANEDGDELGALPPNIAPAPAKLAGARDAYSKPQGPFTLTADEYQARHGESVNPDWRGSEK